MKVKLSYGGYESELWDISYTHLKHLLPLRIKILKETTSAYNRTFRKIHRYPHIMRKIKRLQTEIKFLERELKYRNDYPEYRTFCELFVVGVNYPNPDRPLSKIHMTVRHDSTFLSEFADWCQDHNMMVQSRKLMRLIDRIKGYQKEKLVSEIMKQPMKLKEFE